MERCYMEELNHMSEFFVFLNFDFNIKQNAIVSVCMITKEFTILDSNCKVLVWDMRNLC